MYTLDDFNAESHLSCCHVFVVTIVVVVVAATEATNVHCLVMATAASNPNPIALSQCNLKGHRKMLPTYFAQCFLTHTHTHNAHTCSHRRKQMNTQSADERLEGFC